MLRSSSPPRFPYEVYADDDASCLQGVIALLDHPHQLRDLLNDPSLVKPFVEELCRYYVASSFATRRVAKVDVTIGGQVRFVPSAF